MAMRLTITGRRRKPAALVLMLWADHAGAVRRVGAERKPGEGRLGLGLLCVVERGEKLVRGRLHGLELFLSLLADLGHERKAILRAQLAHGLVIDALTGRLHRGRGILDRLG